MKTILLLLTTLLAYATSDRVALQTQFMLEGKLITQPRTAVNSGQLANLRFENGKEAYAVEITPRRLAEQMVDLEVKIYRLTGQRKERINHFHSVTVAGIPASVERVREGEPTIKLSVTPTLE